MSNLFVKAGNNVHHNGVLYEAGEQITGDVSDKEAQALLNAGVVTDKSSKAASTASEADHEPTAEEVAAAAAAAGGDAKKGLFR